MSHSQAISSYTSVFRALCTPGDAAGRIHAHGQYMKRSSKINHFFSVHFKGFCILTGLAFTLSGCSSFPFFSTEHARHKRESESLYSQSVSDVEMGPIKSHEKIEVSSLSPSIVDKNIANSKHTLPAEQPTRVEIESLKSKPEVQASFSTPTESLKSRTPVALSRSSVTGKWAIREAGNASCKVLLSSAPALDLYKASTSGCNGPDIRTVNSWDFRNGEIYLYARGNVVARFKGNGSSLQGALSKSGAPLMLSR